MRVVSETPICSSITSGRESTIPTSKTLIGTTGRRSTGHAQKVGTFSVLHNVESSGITATAATTNETPLDNDSRKQIYYADALPNTETSELR